MAAGRSYARSLWCSVPYPRLLVKRPEFPESKWSTDVVDVGRSFYAPAPAAGRATA